MAGKYKQTVQEAMNVGLGQDGSIHVAGTTAVTAGMGVFVAITFLEDTTFNTGSTGLTPESAELFPSSDGASTDIDSDGGVAVDSETFPKGVTIYGRWTGFQLATGKVIAYIG